MCQTGSAIRAGIDSWPFKANGALRSKAITSLLMLLLLLAASNAQAVPSMSIDIAGGGPNATIGIGETVTVSLYGNSIPAGGDGNGLFGFGFSIVYDDALLSSADAAAGALWTGVGFTDSRNDPGDVGITANRFFMTSGPSGDDILLASIDFTGSAAGTSSLALGYYTGGSGDNVLFDASVLDTSASFFQSGSINVVPEPHTALLFGMGLMFLGVRQRRQISR